MDWLNLLNPPELIKAIVSYRNRARPRIDFEYKLSLPENDYCHFRIDVNTDRNCLFLRLGVNNHGNKRIEEADVRVERIEIIDRDGNRQIISSSPFFLHWANENTDNSRSIYPNTPVFVDFIYTDEGRHGVASFFFKNKHRSSGIREFLTPGKWVVTVKLLGNDIEPVEKEIHIDFTNGKWNEIKMKLLEI